MNCATCERWRRENENDRGTDRTEKGERQVRVKFSVQEIFQVVRGPTLLKRKKAGCLVRVLTKGPNPYLLSSIIVVGVIINSPRRPENVSDFESFRGVVLVLRP